MSPAKRLKNRDYSAPGLYFVTTCSSFKKCIFGNVVNERVELSALGRIVRETWLAVPKHFSQTNLHEFVVMPNHFHGIVELTSVVVVQHAAPISAFCSSPIGHTQAGSVSAIMCSFKAQVTRRARLELNQNGEIWQRNYFDRVIRDGKEFAQATRYIAENPMKWEWDAENLAAKDANSKARLAQHAAPLQGRRPTASRR